jgi:hypothetical protein
MMTDSGAPVLLTDRRHAPEAMAPGVRVVLLDADWRTIARESEARLGTECVLARRASIGILISWGPTGPVPSGHRLSRERRDPERRSILTHAGPGIGIAVPFGPSKDWHRERFVGNKWHVAMMHYRIAVSREKFLHPT